MMFANLFNEYETFLKHIQECGISVTHLGASEFHESLDYLSLVMRKRAFCICENKDADQLRSNCAADQRLCFRYTDTNIPLLPKSEISSLWPSSVAVQPGLCRTRSETSKTGFLTTRPIYLRHSSSVFGFCYKVVEALCELV